MSQAVMVLPTTTWEGFRAVPSDAAFGSRLCLRNIHWEGFRQICIDFPDEG